MEARVARLIEEAKKFAEAAEAGLAGWEREGKDEIIRDSAEKAWNAVAQATSALPMARGYPKKR